MDTDLAAFAPVLEKIDWEWWQITAFVAVVLFFWNMPKMGRIKNDRLKIDKKYVAIEKKADRDMSKFKAKRAAKLLAKQKKEK